MKAAARALVLVLGGAACSGHRSPPRPPAPAQPPTTVAARPVPRDAATKLPDTIPQVVIGAIPDSVLTRQAVAVFGDSTVAPPDSSLPEGPTWDIDVRSYETHRRVEFYVNAFRGSARERFIARLEKGSRYEPMIRQKFRAANIP